MDQPSFSIVVPTYQRCDSVCAVVRSLSEQGYKGPLEVIVVVDGSTDGTAAALGRLKCRLPLRVIEQANRGAAAARNRGAAEATGEVLLFLDDDMIAEQNLVEQHARIHLSGADAVTGLMRPHAELPRGFPWQHRVAAENYGPHLPETAFDVLTGQLSVKRAVFTELGGFDESFTADGRYGNEDIDFGARLVKKYTVSHNPEAVTRQLNAIRPSQFMRRAKLLGQADVKFARKHPQLAQELFDRRGASRASSRFFYRPLGRIPLLPAVLAGMAVGMAEIGWRTRPQFNRHLSRLFLIAYTISYWSAADAGPRLFSSKQLQ